MNNIYDWTLSQLQTIMENRGYKKYNGEQILRWLYQNRVQSFDEMTNISKEFREKLKENFKLTEIEIIDKLVSNVDKTTKYLFKLESASTAPLFYCSSIWSIYKLCWTSYHIGC